MIVLMTDHWILQGEFTKNKNGDYFATEAFCIKYNELKNASGQKLPDLSKCSSSFKINNITTHIRSIIAIIKK